MNEYMLWPWQIISKLFSLNFIYKIDFDFDHQKILNEYNEAENKLSKGYYNQSIEHDGGWDVIGLYSVSGHSSDVGGFKNPDVITKPTEIIKYFPYTDKVIKGLLKKYNCKPRRIRFSKLKPKKIIRWHRDWDECIEYNNSRLHIPLIVNDKCKGYLCHQSYRWYPGGIFYGDYSFPHRVVNNGQTVRLHLVIDLKDPKNLFKDSNKFYQEEIKRKRYKKFVVLFFNIFFKKPRRLLWLLTFYDPTKKQ
tara:strand:- start:168 stop:914 length:747 start_codon:yes stop_codon:yes gene_type:complete